MSANLLIFGILDAWLAQRVALFPAIFADVGIREYTVRRSNGSSPLNDPPYLAGMAELVDAPDSKSGFGNKVGVRFPLPAPSLNWLKQ